MPLSSADLDQLSLDDLRLRLSEKWNTYPDDVLPAWVAEMDFPLAPEVRDVLVRAAERGDVGYPIAARATGLPEAFSKRMQERFGWSPNPARTEILTDVVQGIFISLEAFAQRRRGVVVQTPIYPPFLEIVRMLGRRLVDNPLVAGTDRYEMDLDGLRETLDDGARLILFCNPHNPTGRVFRRDELEGVAALARERDWMILTDEIHQDLVYSPARHIAFATLGPEVAARTVTLTSATKAFNIPGLRCAVAHFGTADLQERFNQLHPAHIRGGIGLLGIYASIAAWRWGQPWLDEVVPYLQANRDYALQAFEERIPEIRFYPPESTYLAWLDCSALELEGSPAAHFRKHGSVALSGGRRFGATWEQHVRLNFATSRPILTDVIDRMAKALGR